MTINTGIESVRYKGTDYIYSKSYHLDDNITAFFAKYSERRTFAYLKYNNILVTLKFKTEIIFIKFYTLKLVFESVLS